MKDPVFLQSERTYERSAIENWFDTCRLQGRPLTCPVSGQILTSTDLRPSLVLRQTIKDAYKGKSSVIPFPVNRIHPSTDGKPIATGT